MTIEVIPEAKSFKSDCFTYTVPLKFKDQLRIGSIVDIPFGKKKIRGVVANIKDDQHKAGKSGKFSIKEILSADPESRIPASYLPVIDWLAGKYFCTPGEALSLFLPPEMKRPPKPGSIEERLFDRNGLKELSSAQAGIYSEIKKAGFDKSHLIYGVTGSGKTEIYLHLAADAIAAGKSVVVLVPEIILTPQTVDRFSEIFGDNIALVHSNLSTGEKYQAYRDFSSGSKKIIIGPRSALLVPNENIGLIIIDEEHEDAYKQDNAPRYNAIDLAEKIAAISNAMLVMGSATPRIESFYKAQNGQYILHQIKNRYNKLILPPAEVIDLRDELKKGNYSLISEKLASTLRKILADKKQAILFLNRRGSSTFVSCRECGFVLKCPSCDIPLVHHTQPLQAKPLFLSRPPSPATRPDITSGLAGTIKNKGLAYDHLYCHHCDFKSELPTVCPDCHGVKIKYFGAGVEKVESEVRSFFPEAKIRRIDATTIKNKGDYEKFYRDFKDRKFDIAIGTQMITKGLDLPHVDLVGIISADTGLHLPYFRASEKIFRLVTQVSGRSGRAKNPGQTIIQTYWPQSTAIQFAANHDFEGFYNHEIEKRKQHNYPPFTELIRIVSEHEKAEKAKNELVDLSLKLDEMQNKFPEQFEYIGPGLCFFQRLRNKWRYHILIKMKDKRTEGQKNNDDNLMRQLRTLWRENLNLTWDAHPYDLL